MEDEPKYDLEDYYDRICLKVSLANPRRELFNAKMVWSFFEGVPGMWCEDIVEAGTVIGRSTQDETESFIVEVNNPPGHDRIRVMGTTGERMLWPGSIYNEITLVFTRGEDLSDVWRNAVHRKPQTIGTVIKNLDEIARMIRENIDIWADQDP